MRADLVLLFAAMGLATYALRAGPLLVAVPAGMLRRANPYLRLVAPAVLSALAAIATLVVVDGGQAQVRLSVDVAAVVLGVLVVARRGNLALGIIAGVACAALGRALAVAG